MSIMLFAVGTAIVVVAGWGLIRVVRRARSSRISRATSRWTKAEGDQLAPVSDSWVSSSSSDSATTTDNAPSSSVSCGGSFDGGGSSGDWSSSSTSDSSSSDSGSSSSND